MRTDLMPANPPPNVVIGENYFELQV
jgi:hypothetical protein